MITQDQISKGYTYPQYQKLLEDLLAQGKTTGHDQVEEKLEYAKLNFHRMARIDKTVALSTDLLKALKKVNKQYVWLVLTEGWCGDTAQSVPLFNAIASACPAVELRLLLRDDNPAVMDMYLTKGSRSIPKLICFEKATLKEVFTWGPRPAPLQALVMQLVKDHIPKDEKGLIVQKWYNADQTRTIQEEFRQLIEKYMSS